MVNIISLMKESFKDKKESLEVKQAQIGVEISRYDMDSSKSGHMPKVSINASHSEYDTDTPNSDYRYDSVQSIKVTLDIPIFSGGYVSSRVAESRFKLNAAKEDLISTQKEAQVQHDEYIAQFEASSESVSMHNNSFVSAKLYVDAIEQGYSHGLKRFFANSVFCIATPVFEYLLLASWASILA
jgi:outer membrane protein TolC